VLGEYRALSTLLETSRCFPPIIVSSLTFFCQSEVPPASWFRVGVVVDRTKALGSKFDIRRGPLVGFKYQKVDFTTYWLSPGSKEATFVFATTVNF